jgi:glycosyltransferase involved in cell wall biosynthesis
MISLIVASWNRTLEPERLLKSLDDQTYRNFEVIVADQNQDQRLDNVVRTHPDLRVKHLRLERGLSSARNTALPLVGGDIIAFPDDDCWYPPELLAKVKSWFEEHPEFDVLFTATRDGDGELMAPKFPLKRGACTKASVLRCAVTFNGFIRTQAALAVGSFREDIGPGTSSPYQSGEDLDYFIRPIECGFAAWYEPALTVYHPSLKSKARLLSKTYPYALGVGYVLREHNYPLWVIADLVLRSLCGAALHLCKFDLDNAKIYALRAKGEIQGYFGGRRHTATNSQR